MSREFSTPETDPMNMTGAVDGRHESAASKMASADRENFKIENPEADLEKKLAAMGMSREEFNNKLKEMQSEFPFDNPDALNSEGELVGKDIEDGYTMETKIKIAEKMAAEEGTKLESAEMPETA